MAVSRIGSVAGRAALLLLCVAGAAAPAFADEGQDLFRRQCGICHLENGTGTFMLGRRLGADKALLESRGDLAPAYVKTVVRWGLLSMPRFTRIELSDAQLDSIAGYLAAPGPKAAAGPVAP